MIVVVKSRNSETENVVAVVVQCRPSTFIRFRLMCPQPRISGHILAHVSWQCPLLNPEVLVSGYKVLVDGKQYGCSLHSGIRNGRIKVRYIPF